MMRIENHVYRFANAKLETVIFLESLALDAFSIDVGSVLATLIDDAKLPIFRNDKSMFTRDPRIGDHQIFIHLAADAEGAVVEIDRALLVALHENQRRKYSRPWLRSRIDDA